MSLFVVVSLGTNVAYAQAPGCSTSSSVVNYYDMPSLHAMFPADAYLGRTYYFTVPNASCLARNPQAYGYYDQFGNYIPYQYPYGYPYYVYPYSVNWSWAKGPVTGSLWKVHPSCYLSNFFGADVAKCR